MTKEEFVSKALGGAPMMLGEYRMSRAEMLEWRDKSTGRAMSGPKLTHQVEFGNVSVQVSERVPEGTKLQDIIPPFKRGQNVVLTFSEFKTTLGLCSARGSLEALEAPSRPPLAGVGSTSGARSA